jgi:outer membrane protein TolC
MNKSNILYSCLAIFTALLTIFDVSNSYAGEQSLSFEKAIKMAQKNDPWLDGSRHKQESLEFLSYSANTQPDPKVSIAFANLPTNGFDFAQEGMTQFKVGVSQMFARGDSLAIKNQQLQLQSQEQPLQRQDRQNKVAVTVGSLWLDLYRVQKSISLIEQNRNLFEQLSQLAEASYSSGLGKTRQHDIVRAQLELTRLEDKLNQLKQEQSSYQGMLGQWLSDYTFNENSAEQAHKKNNFLMTTVSSELPKLDLNKKFSVYDEKQLKTEQLALILSDHPAVQAIEKKVVATHVEVDLAEQKYQPQWGINASYGYRADDKMGKSRADLFSVGVVFDVPLFTDNRQDNEVKSAISKTEAVKTEKLLLIRQLMSQFSSAKSSLLRLIERQILYKERLLPQIHDQAQAYLTAYTNNDGDFAEVVRARIAELNAQIDFLAINVQQQKIILEINYFLSGTRMQLQVGTQL